MSSVSGIAISSNYLPLCTHSANVSSPPLPNLLTASEKLRKEEVKHRLLEINPLKPFPFLHAEALKISVNEFEQMFKSYCIAKQLEVRLIFYGGACNYILDKNLPFTDVDIFIKIETPIFEEIIHAISHVFWEKLKAFKIEVNIQDIHNTLFQTKKILPPYGTPVKNQICLGDLDISIIHQFSEIYTCIIPFDEDTYNWIIGSEPCSQAQLELKRSYFDRRLIVVEDPKRLPNLFRRILLEQTRGFYPEEEQLIEISVRYFIQEYQLHKVFMWKSLSYFVDNHFLNKKEWGKFVYLMNCFHILLNTSVEDTIIHLMKFKESWKLDYAVAFLDTFQSTFEDESDFKCISLFGKKYPELIPSLIDLLKGLCLLDKLRHSIKGTTLHSFKQNWHTRKQTPILYKYIYFLVLKNPEETFLDALKGWERLETIKDELLLPLFELLFMKINWADGLSILHTNILGFMIPPQASLFSFAESTQSELFQFIHSRADEKAKHLIEMRSIEYKLQTAINLARTYGRQQARQIHERLISFFQDPREDFTSLNNFFSKVVFTDPLEVDEYKVWRLCSEFFRKIAIERMNGDGLQIAYGLFKLLKPKINPIEEISQQKQLLIAFSEFFNQATPISVEEFNILSTLPSFILEIDVTPRPFFKLLHRLLVDPSPPHFELILSILKQNSSRAQQLKFFYEQVAYFSCLLKLEKSLLESAFQTLESFLVHHHWDMEDKNRLIKSVTVHFKAFVLCEANITQLSLGLLFLFRLKASKIPLLNFLERLLDQGRNKEEVRPVILTLLNQLFALDIDLKPIAKGIIGFAENLTDKNEASSLINLLNEKNRTKKWQLNHELKLLKHLFDSFLTEKPHDSFFAKVRKEVEEVKSCISPNTYHILSTLCDERRSVTTLILLTDQIDKGQANEFWIRYKKWSAQQNSSINTQLNWDLVVSNSENSESNHSAKFLPIYLAANHHFENLEGEVLKSRFSLLLRLLQNDQDTQLQSPHITIIIRLVEHVLKQVKIHEIDSDFSDHFYDRLYQLIFSLLDSHNSQTGFQLFCLYNQFRKWPHDARQVSKLLGHFSHYATQSSLNVSGHFSDISIYKNLLFFISSLLTTDFKLNANNIQNILLISKSRKKFLFPNSLIEIQHLFHSLMPYKNLIQQDESILFLIQEQLLEFCKKGVRWDLSVQSILKITIECFYTDPISLNHNLELFKSIVKEKKKLDLLSELFVSGSQPLSPILCEHILMMLFEANDDDLTEVIVEHYKVDDDCIIALCKKMMASCQGILSHSHFFTIALLMHQSRKPSPKILSVLFNYLQKNSHPIFLKVLRRHLGEFIRLLTINDIGFSLKKSKKIFEYLHHQLVEYKKNSNQQGFNETYILFNQFFDEILILYNGVALLNVVAGSSKKDSKNDPLFLIYQECVLVFLIKIRLLQINLPENDLCTVLHYLDLLSSEFLQDEWAGESISQLMSLQKKTVSAEIYGYLNGYLSKHFKSRVNCYGNSEFFNAFSDWIRATIVISAQLAPETKRNLLNIMIVYLGNFWRYHGNSPPDQVSFTLVKMKSSLLLELLTLMIEVYNVPGLPQLKNSLELRDLHLAWLSQGSTEMMTKSGMFITMHVLTYPRQAFALTGKEIRLLSIDECLDWVVNKKYAEIVECCDYALAKGQINLSVLMEYIMLIYNLILESKDLAVCANKYALLASLTHVFINEFHGDENLLAFITHFFELIKSETKMNNRNKQDVGTRFTPIAQDIFRLYSIIEEHPEYLIDYPYINRILIFCYSRLNNANRTIAELNRLLNITKNNPYRMLILESLLVNQLEAENFSSSLKLLDILIAHNTTKLGEYIKIQAQVCYALGYVEKSVTLFQQAIAHNDGLHNYKDFARICIEHNRQTELDEIFKAIYKKNDSDFKEFSEFLRSADREVFIIDTIITLFQSSLEAPSSENYSHQLQRHCQLMVHMYTAKNNLDLVEKLSAPQITILINYLKERTEKYVQNNNCEEGDVESNYEFLIVLLIHKKEVNDIRNYCNQLGKKFPKNKQLMRFIIQLKQLEKSTVEV